MSRQILPNQMEECSNIGNKAALLKLYSIFNKIMDEGGTRSQDNIKFKKSKLKDKEHSYMAELSGFTCGIKIYTIIPEINDFSKNATDINIELRAKNRLMFVIPRRVIRFPHKDPNNNRMKTWLDKEKECDTLVEALEKDLQKESFYRTILYRQRYWRVYVEKISRDIFQHFSGMCIECKYEVVKLSDTTISFTIQFTRGMETIDLRTLYHISKKHERFTRDVEIFPNMMKIKFIIESPKQKKRKKEYLEDISSEGEYDSNKKRRRGNRQYSTHERGRRKRKRKR